MKRVLAFILALVMTLSLFTICGFAAGSTGNSDMEVNPPEGKTLTDLVVGDTVTVVLKNKAMTVTSFSCGVAFDKERFTCESIVGTGKNPGKYYLTDEFGDTVQSTAASKPAESNNTGTVGFAWGGTEDATYVASAIARITFTVKGIGTAAPFTLYEESDGADGMKSDSIMQVEAKAFAYLDELASCVITAPTKGGTPQNDLSNMGGVKYSGTITWTPAVSGTFAPGTPYTAHVTLTANEGYKFPSNVTAGCTGGTVKKGSVSLTDGGKTLTFDVEFAATENAAALGGTVMISGQAMFGYTLTANTSALNYNGEDPGTLRYQWKRNGDAIEGATKSSYKLVQADIGHNISVEVWNSNNTDSVTSAFAVLVQKALNGENPDAPTLVSKTANSITIRHDRTDVEYLCVEAGTTVTGSAVWTTKTTFNNLNPNRTYDIYARVKESETHKASPASADKLTVTTELGTADEELQTRLKAALTAYTGEYDGTTHNVISGNLTDGWTYVLGTNETTFEGVASIKDAGDYMFYVQFNNPDYKSFVAAYTAKISKATNYLTVTATDKKIFVSTTVGKIVDLTQGYLQLNKTGELDVPAGGTISLAESEGGADLTAASTLDVSTHKLHYVYTPADQKNYETVSGWVTLTVNPRGIESVAVTTQPSNKSFVYGNAFDPTGMVIKATFSDSAVEELPLNDFTWSDLGSVGTGKTVTGTYTKDASVKVTVDGITVTPQPIDQSILDVTLSATSFYYNTQEQKPTVTVSWNGKTLVEGQYTIAFPDDCVNAGSGKEIKITNQEGANYQITGTRTVTYSIYAQPVTITGVTINAKTFDGTKFATIADHGTVEGVYPQDAASVSVDQTLGTASFADVMPGENKTVTFEHFNITGGNGNYVLKGQPASITASISKAELTITTLNAKDKTYDGTNAAEIDYTSAQFDGIVTATTAGGTGVTYSATLNTSKGSATFEDKNYGTHVVSFSGVELSGTSQLYYTLKQQPGNTTATINAYSLTGTNTTKSTSLLMKSSGAFADPVIDGVNNEKLTSENGTFTYSYTSPAGEVTGAEAISNALRALNDVKDYSVSYTFTPNAGSNYTGTVTGTLTVSVKDIEFFKPNGDSIHPAETLLTVTNGTYNAGKADAYVSFPAGITAKVDGTTISGKFYVTVDGLADGAKVPAGAQKFRLHFDSDDGTYNGVEVCAMQSATIYPASIEIDGSKIKVADRAYDGTTDVSDSQIDLSGLKMHIKDGEKTSAIANGEDITLSYTATYDEANAGDRLVEFSNLTLTGADKDNYTLYNSHNFNVTAKITKAIVTIDVRDSGITVAPREYDGTVNGTRDQVNLTGAKLHGVLDAEKANVALAQDPFSIIYSSKAAGNATATLGNLVLTGTAAKNYELKDDTIPVQTSITQRTIAISSIDVADKTYDGSDIAVVKNVVYSNVVRGDEVYANIVARFANVNAGTDKTVNIQVVSWQGKDADNYTFNSVIPLATASIAKAQLVGAPAFGKITKAGTKLREIDAFAALVGIRGVPNEQNPVGLTLTWADDTDTVIEANKAYGWTVTTNNPNYEALTGSTVLYPVSTSYSDQVKKQSEEFEAKKRGELPEDELDFRDVYEDDYFFDAVQWAAENGITGGVGNDRFGPNLDCSRGQTMTFLWRTSGEPEPDSFSTDLTDVAAGSYYYEAVLWAMQEGVTTGAGAGRFAPNATVTRGQFVTFLYRLANASSDGVHPFADVPAGSYYEKAIAWAFAEGITRGTSGTTFSPDAPCTRAQIITFLYRYFNR